MMFSMKAVQAVAVGLALMFALAAPSARAGDQILRAAAPAWVVLSPDVSPPETGSTDEGLKMLLFDAQWHAERDQQSVYIRTRSMALSPQGLVAMGNVALMWSPASQDVTVHHVTLLRDGQEIDVLATQEFATLRREENLELAVLDGRLTAVLQPAGLRVGDVLDIAYTVTTRDSVPGLQFAQIMDMNLPLTVGRQHVRASWPSDMRIAVRAADDWTALPIRRAGGYSSFELTRENIPPVLVPDDIPVRLRAVNLIELSGYRDWAEVAEVLKPLYDRARRLEPDSPIHAEIARIRALSDDPAVQAAAALRLVQEQIRYVALLMGEGGLTPATADETWSRRFGDCKGKTALLLALLDGLGIPADPALVSLQQGDALGRRLPSVAGFDHVLVRAVVADRAYWLDGTRMGDRRLQDISVPSLGWALPLAAADARLERLEVAPLAVPTVETIIALDTTAGQHAPAAVTGSMIMRGETAAALSGQLGMIPAAQREQGLRGVWGDLLADATIDEVGSSYDGDASVLTLTVKGSMPLNWRAEGLIPPGSTYARLSVAERTPGPFQNAPVMVIHPVFTRQLVTVRLPGDGQGFRVAGGQFDRTELGHHMSRTVKLEGDTATVEVLLQSLVAEISAAEAEAGRLALEARPADYPRVIAPTGYQLTAADRAAMAADTPTTDSAWLDRAVALSKAGDHPGAVEAAAKAVELAPQSALAWANLGVYRFWTGDREGAAADLEKAVDLDPSERIAMNGHALLANAEGRHQDVVIEMSRALRQAPTDSFALGMRARAYMAQGEHDRALRDLDALIAANPSRLDVKLQRIAVLTLAERQSDVDAALGDLLRTHPEDRDVRLAVAHYRLIQKRPQEAYDLVQEVIGEEADPAAELRMLRGEAAIALGRLDDAAQDFQAVRAASAGDAFALNDLCWTAALAGVMLDQALRDCDAALALEPDAASILDSRGRVLLQQGDAAAARAAYDAALTKEPTQAASLYGRGLARIALGETEAGEADKAAALAVSSRAAEAFRAYSPPAGAPTSGS